MNLCWFVLIFVCLCARAECLEAVRPRTAAMEWTTHRPSIPIPIRSTATSAEWATWCQRRRLLLLPLRLRRPHCWTRLHLLLRCITILIIIITSAAAAVAAGVISATYTNTTTSSSSSSNSNNLASILITSAAAIRYVSAYSESIDISISISIINVVVSSLIFDCVTLKDSMIGDLYPDLKLASVYATSHQLQMAAAAAAAAAAFGSPVHPAVHHPHHPHPHHPHELAHSLLQQQQQQQHHDTYQPHTSTSSWCHNSRTTSFHDYDDTLQTFAKWKSSTRFLFFKIMRNAFRTLLIAFSFQWQRYRRRRLFLSDFCFSFIIRNHCETAIPIFKNPVRKLFFDATILLIIPQWFTRSFVHSFNLLFVEIVSFARTTDHITCSTHHLLLIL